MVKILLYELNYELRLLKARFDWECIMNCADFEGIDFVTPSNIDVNAPDVVDIKVEIDHKIFDSLTDIFRFRKGLKIASDMARNFKYNGYEIDYRSREYSLLEECMYDRVDAIKDKLKILRYY